MASNNTAIIFLFFDITLTTKYFKSVFDKTRVVQNYKTQTTLETLRMPVEIYCFYDSSFYRVFYKSETDKILALVFNFLNF